MKKFTYHGPDSGVSLKLADGTNYDALLWHGRDVLLPEHHEYTATLLAQQLISAAEESPTAETAKATEGVTAVKKGVK